MKNREEIAQALAAVGLYRRRRTRDRDLADAIAAASAAARRRGGRRQDRGGKGAGSVHATELIRLQCYEGLDQSAALYEWNYQRQLLAIQAHRGDNRRRCRGPDLLGKVPAGAAAAGGDPPRQAAGAADRRDRPRRRRVRGVSARTAVRFPGLDSRTRHDQGDLDPACGADLERHARTLRRAAPPLPLSLCRLSRCRPRGAHHHGADRWRRRVAVAADRAHGRGHPQGGAAQGARRRRDAGLGGGAGRARRARSARRAGDGARDPDVPAQDARGQVARHARGDASACWGRWHELLRHQSRLRRTRRGLAPRLVKARGISRTLRDNGFAVGLAEGQDAAADDGWLCGQAGPAALGVQASVLGAKVRLGKIRRHV